MSEKMKSYRYTLEKSKKKNVCPKCGEKTFVRYINKETKELLPENFGRCDRETKCRYFQPPRLETRCFFVPADKVRSITKKAIVLHQDKEEFTLPKSVIHEELASGVYVAEYFLKDEKGKQVKKKVQPIKYDEGNVKYFLEGGLAEVGKPLEYIQEVEKDPVFLPIEVLEKTLNEEAYTKNQFIKNLLFINQINPKDLKEVIHLYLIGTIEKGWLAGSVTFPFIDIKGNVRAIQIKQFDEDNHTTKTNFIHTYLEGYWQKKNRPFPDWFAEYKDQKTKVSCFFGEHLLKEYPRNPVALVEAPKTAIIATLYEGLPKTEQEPIWLATYSKSTFTFERVKVLEGRKVVVYPDLSEGGKTFLEWKGKAEEFSNKMKNTKFLVSDLIEKLASDEDRKQGKDIADFLSEDSIQEYTSEEEQGVHLVKAKEFTFEEILASCEQFKRTPKEQFSQEIEDRLDFKKDPSELVSFFSGIVPPEEEIQLEIHSVIKNPKKFIAYHLQSFENTCTNPRTKRISFEKLEKLKQYLENNK